MVLGQRAPPLQLVPSMAVFINSFAAGCGYQTVPCVESRSFEVHTSRGGAERVLGWIQFSLLCILRRK